MWRRLLLLSSSCCLPVRPVPAGAASQTEPPASGACASGDPAFTNDDLSGIAALYAAGPATYVETLYFQNASRVGGTALAAYPLFRIRAGVVHRLEAVSTRPRRSPIRPNGAGLYPMTHLGFGLNYAAVDRPRSPSASASSSCRRVRSSW